MLRCTVAMLQLRCPGHSLCLLCLQSAGHRRGKNEEAAAWRQPALPQEPWGHHPAAAREVLELRGYTLDLILNRRLCSSTHPPRLLQDTRRRCITTADGSGSSVQHSATRAAHSDPPSATSDHMAAAPRHTRAWRQPAPHNSSAHHSQAQAEP